MNVLGYFQYVKYFKQWLHGLASVTVTVTVTIILFRCMEIACDYIQFSTMIWFLSPMGLSYTTYDNVEDTLN